MSDEELKRLRATGHLANKFEDFLRDELNYELPSGVYHADVEQVRQILTVGHDLVVEDDDGNKYGVDVMVHVWSYDE